MDCAYPNSLDGSQEYWQYILCEAVTHFISFTSWESSTRAHQCAQFPVLSLPKCFPDPPPTKIDDISVEDFRSLLDFNLVSYFFTIKV